MSRASYGGSTSPSARRVVIVGGIFVVTIALGLVALLGRVVQLQIRPDPRITARIDSQRSGRALHGRRGAIFDRRGRLLVASRIAHQLFVDPQRVEDPNTFAEQLGYELGYDPVRLAREIGVRSHRRWVLIDREISDERRAQLATVKLAGAGTQKWLKRDYVHGSRAGQLLGFVGREGHGLEGMEWGMDSRLKAADGQMHYVRDVTREPLWVSHDGYKPPRAGRSVRLTIDLTIQAFTENVLADTCHTFRAESGQIVVMDAVKGEILAMANYPFFDPSEGAKAPAASRRNRCVTDAIEPGSIFKPFIWARALESATVSLNERIDCTASGFYVSPEGRRLRDTRGHGVLTWEQVLVKSSNIGMAIVGRRMGVHALHDAITGYGFGRSTFCGVPGEALGLVRPTDAWTHHSVTSVTMGHEIAVTPIQMVAAFTAFAGDGTMVKPTIHLRETGDGGRPIRQRVMSRQTAETVRRVMRDVVLEGTGRRANSRRYAIFGKTGTAQVPDLVAGGYLDDTYVSSFLCGAPVEAPRIVVGCFIHGTHQETGYYGGTVAGPTAREVVERTLEYLKVPPAVSTDREPRRLVQR